MDRIIISTKEYFESEKEYWKDGTALIKWYAPEKLKYFEENFGLFKGTKSIEEKLNH
jgi:hypothetical protein